MQIIKNEIMLGDCMDLLAELPDKSIDLAIVDPPYGIGEDGSKNITRGKQASFGKNSKSKAKTYAKEYKPYSGNDKEPPAIEYFDEIKRVSRKYVIFGANHFITRINIDSPCWLVWDKDNGETDFADCELALTNFDTTVRKFKYKWQGMLQENMKEKENRVLPNQKPVALYRWILQKYAKPGQLILDTHSGSGSLACACHIEKFDFIAIEKDPHYHALSVKRLEELRSQGVLF